MFELPCNIFVRIYKRCFGLPQVSVTQEQFVILLNNPLLLLVDSRHTAVCQTGVKHHQTIWYIS